MKNAENASVSAACGGVAAENAKNEGVIEKVHAETAATNGSAVSSGTAAAAKKLNGHAGANGDARPKTKRLTRTERAILDYAADNPGRTPEQIAKALKHLGKTKSFVANLLTERGQAGRADA